MPIRRDLVDDASQRRWAESRQRVGLRVRQLRTEAGMTQEALSRQSGLSRNQLIELEQGRRGVLFERLEDLARALEVPVSQLFTKG